VGRPARRTEALAPTRPTRPPQDTQSSFLSLGERSRGNTPKLAADQFLPTKNVVNLHLCSMSHYETRQCGSSKYLYRAYRAYRATFPPPATTCVPPTVETTSLPRWSINQLKKFGHLDKTKDLAANPAETHDPDDPQPRALHANPARRIVAAIRQSHTISPASTSFRWRTPILCRCSSPSEVR
jgi:hypothetical protein